MPWRECSLSKYASKRSSYLYQGNGDIPPVDGDKYMSELRSLLFNNTDRLSVNGGLESLLAKYIHGFTGNRNHTTVSCQSTRNKEVQYELLSVIDRLGCDTKNAFLYFPLDNIVYEFDVNHSITVTNFHDTMYVEDPARGSSGESVLYGLERRNTSRRLCIRQSSTLDRAPSPVPSSCTSSSVKVESKYDEEISRRKIPMMSMSRTQQTTAFPSKRKKKVMIWTLMMTERVFKRFLTSVCRY